MPVLDRAPGFDFDDPWVQKEILKPVEDFLGRLMKREAKIREAFRATEMAQLCRVDFLDRVELE